jgi:uncharacterized protein YndB with AHSA1/START domain
MSASVTPFAKPSDRELVITRVFNAPRALVFRAWTDPKLAIQWWGPKHHPGIEVNMDVRVGGAWSGCLRSEETGVVLWHRGVYREIVPDERLVFTFAWDEEGERGIENIITLTFADEGGKTRMTLRQTPFQSVAERDGHGEGWGSALDRLETSLAAHT